MVPAGMLAQSLYSTKDDSKKIFKFAPVAQLDRVLASEAKGRGFESRRARQIKTKAHHLMGFSFPQVIEIYQADKTTRSTSANVLARIAGSMCMPTWRLI